MLVYTLGRSLLDSLEDSVEDRIGLQRFGVALMLAIALIVTLLWLLGPGARLTPSAP